ncbi:PXA domain-containing protein [Xylariaceae sp. FL0016]|nr:PXA domain-containing protein [Xylariaceae sp. FL0016]
MAATMPSGPLPASLKAPATSGTSAASVTSEATRFSGPTRVASPLPQRRVPRPLSSDFLSDKATAALIRRVLCAQNVTDRERATPAPIHDLLPPLTSSNDVDLQLYALISIIIRDFVQNWYIRITPDRTFVSEIIQIIAHCTRALEQRLRKVDLESLLFDELPDLFDAHDVASRISRTSAARPPVKTDSREIYHALCPIPALSPVPRSNDQKTAEVLAENESAYRQLLVQGVLAVLLPTEDLENECLTSLVGQILSELIIGNLVVNKLSEPWLLYEIMIIITRKVSEKDQAHTNGGSAERSAVPDPKFSIGHISKRTGSLHQMFWAVLQWVFLAATSIRVMINALVLSRSLPPRSTSVFASSADSTIDLTSEKSHHSSPAVKASPPVRVPIADFHIWSFIGNLLEMDRRMPWLCGALTMMQWGAMRGPGMVAGFNGVFDRLFSHYIHISVLDPARLPPLLQAIRGAVFPNNAPGSSSLSPPSSDEQLAALRRRCASTLLASIPKGMARIYYGSGTWPWSGTGEGSKAVDGTTSSSDAASPRSEPHRSKRSNVSNHTATVNQRVSSSRSGEEVARVRLTDEGKTDKPNASDVTLASSVSGSERQLQYHTGESCPTEDEFVPGISDQGNIMDQDHERMLSEIESGILDVFSDTYCNKHLIYGILELVLVRLIPELAERGVGELWEERLS